MMSRKKLHGRWGHIALAAYLFLVGLQHLLGLTFSGFPLVVGLVAIAAAVLLVMGR